ncbi:MAG: hypothetical protein ABEJ68_04215 [Halobacteriaceae archaeon]
MSVRFKPVPAPPTDRHALAGAQAALPLVPKGENDCCGRLLDRTDFLDGRDEARTWLTFLRALGLAKRTDGRFARTDRDPESEAVETAFRERVFGAREVLAALGAEPIDADDAFEAVADAVPPWERERHNNWAATYRERAANLLGWAAVLGFATRTDSGYRAASSRG